MDQEVPDLNEKHKKFCEEYITDCNATRAYKAVYPKTKDPAARSSACNLLTKPNVRAYIKELQKDVEFHAEVNRLMVVKEVKEIAFSSNKKEVATYEKLKALDSLSKMLGYNEPEKIEHSGQIIWNEEKTYE